MSDDRDIANLEQQGVLGSLVDLLTIAGIAAGGLAVVSPEFRTWVLEQIGGIFTGPKSGEGTSIKVVGGNGQLVEGEEADLAVRPFGLATNHIGSVPLGGTIDVSSALWVGFFVMGRFRNTGTKLKYLKVNLEWTEQLAFRTDRRWFGHGTRGTTDVTANYPADNGLKTLAEPKNQMPVAFEPGQELQVSVGWIVDAAMASQLANEFWKNTGHNVYNSSFSFYEVDDPNLTSLNIVASNTWREALHTDYP